MAETKEINVVITADSKQAEKGLNKTADAIDNLGSSASNMSARMSRSTAILESMAKMFQELNSNVSAMRKSLESIDAKNVKKVADEVDNVDKKAKKASSGIKGLAAQCTQMSAAMNAIAAIQVGGMFTSMAGSLISMGTASVQAAAQMRQYEIAFQTMLKSAEDGTQMLRDLQQFAAATPFDVPGVVSAGQQLMAFGFKAQEIIPMLTSLGDAASGLGLGTEGVSRLAYALGQMQTSGKLNAQDMMQLTSAGIAAWDMLAQAAGKTVAEMKDLCSKGAIDSKAAVQTIVEGINSQFGGMMEKTSGEITGLLANIEETVGTTAAVVGDYLIKTFNIKEHLQSASDALGKFQQQMQKASDGGKSLTDVIKDCIPPEVIAATGALAAVFGVLAAAAVVAIAGAATAVLGLSAAMAAAVVAVGAAVALIIVYWDDIVDAVKIAINGVLDAFALLATGITEAVLGVVKFITGAIGGLWADVTGDQDNWFNSFAKMMGDAMEAVENFAKKAIAWFDSVFEAKNRAVDTRNGDAELKQIQEDDKTWQEGKKSNRAAPTLLMTPTSKASGSKSGSSAKQENLALKAAQQENKIAQERLKIENEYVKQKLKKEKDLFTAQNALAKQYGTDSQKHDIELAEIEFNRKQELASEELSYKEQMLAAENSLKEAYLKGAAQQEIEMLQKKKQLIEDTHQTTIDSINTSAAASVANSNASYDTTTATWKAQYNTSSTVDQMNMDNDKQKETATDEANQLANYQQKVEALTAINQKYDEQKAKIETINKIQQTGNQLVKDFASGIADWITGAQSFGDAMKNILKSLIAQLIQAAMYALILASLGIGTGSSFGAKFSSNFGKGFATGGEVNGPGTGTSDSIPVMLSNGEYVLNADAVDRLGVPFLNGLNTGRLQGFATGGLVGAGGNYRADSAASAGSASTTSITLNVSALDASSFSDFLARGGMQVIKQATLDDNRNFNAAFETF